jgi:hypothetical protein
MCGAVRAASSVSLQDVGRSKICAKICASFWDIFNYDECGVKQIFLFAYLGPKCLCSVTVCGATDLCVQLMNTSLDRLCKSADDTFWKICMGGGGGGPLLFCFIFIFHCHISSIRA